MRRVSTSRTIHVPAARAWSLLVDTRRWPEWGPSVRSAELAGGEHLVHEAAQGVVTTIVGVRLPFEITEWSAGESWRWTVMGLPATGHSVRPIGDDRCEVSFDVPWFEAPYLAICRLALGRIADLAGAEHDDGRPGIT